ncbi:hypothetical protein HMI55_002334 [Coelomomyces lativittatus]|nr:hypothetical protein HMI55_002334 [Coelomomyces lativittatus]
MVPVPVNPKVKPLPPPPPRSHQNIPELLSIRVSTTLPDSSRSKHLLLNAFSQLEFITGHYPTLLRADQANVLLGLRKGMPWGAEVVLTQDDMYMFLDKLVEWVFPRLKNWYGIPLHTGTSSSSSSTPIPQGELHLNFDPWVTSYFPEIEQTYDRFTQMCPLHVIFKTSACSDWETRMLLSGFQIPMEDHVSKSKREKYNLKPTSEDLDEPEWMKFKRAREELMDKKNEK